MSVRKDKKAAYSLNAKGEFIIEEYNYARPFANFFPGIAGKYGIPIWAFYVNRGQAIVSFGTKDKDHAILEFFPANKAWQLASSHGFRTFIKCKDTKKVFYEPFQNGHNSREFTLTNRMRITSAELALEEDNATLGLSTRVEYFTIPNDTYGALARVVQIKNTSKKVRILQIVDGLPQIIPFGTNNWFLKEMSRTIEAWMDVENLDRKVPYYRLRVDPADRPEVVHIKEGNFYLGFEYKNGTPRIITPIVNPQTVFGLVMDLSFPQAFLAKAFRLPAHQITTSRTPAAFLHLEITLKPGEEKSFYALTGHMRSLEILNSSLPRIIAPGYLSQKQKENRALIAELQQDITTKSSSLAFDLYTKQTYLDNILRGGYPLSFSSGSVFYLYSRKHGDLERDYNRFQIQPAYLSQGNGNYRDVNQNRRCDSWFHPFVKDENIVTFFNLLQLDGFNPLIVKGSTFTLKDEDAFKAALKGLVKENGIPEILSYLRKPFTPGEFIFFIEEHGLASRNEHDALLDAVIGSSEKHSEAEHGEGFWTDHWTYNLDLLESYLALFPEKLQELVFKKRVFTFFDNIEVVKPRQEKYILQGGKVRQLHSLAIDTAKKDLIHKRHHLPHLVRMNNGAAEIYQTTLLNKLLCVVVNKLSSLDPFGVGIEMEADKPDWYDALNGLPALLGSSLNETFELKRLILFIRRALVDTAMVKVCLTQEVWDFLYGLNGLMEDYFQGEQENKDFLWWEKSGALKDEYRQKTKLGVDGKEIEITALALGEVLDKALSKLEGGIVKAKDHKREFYPTYFINEVLEYESLKNPFVRPTKFIQRRLPPFLEGQVHALKLEPDIAKARALYKATRASALFDKKLKMYKVTASLKTMPEEIGRCRAFAPGWLEAESIWLHMEYKYLLEVLRKGLHKEFFADFKNVFIPFQNPRRYGRSILENSSFLVSSAFSDKSLQGNGFVARLSGSTAEFLQIWHLMNVGEKPFGLDASGTLTLSFRPILPGWLFNKKEKTYTFQFLSKVQVTYHNSLRKDTFGPSLARIKSILLSDNKGLVSKIEGDTIRHPFAEDIRALKINQIDIYLG